MRVLAVAVAAVALIGAVVLAVGLVSLNRLVAVQRTDALHRAEVALGRPLAVDAATISLWRGPGVRFENVRIADDRADAVTARVRFWPLLRGRFVVRRIDVERPLVHLVRDAAGRWNYGLMAALPLAPAASPTAASTGAMAGTHAPPPPISSARVEDGTVIVLDQTQAPPRTFRIDHLTLSLSDISTTTSIQVALTAAVDAESENVRVHGVVGPVQNSAAIPAQLDATLGPFGVQQITIDALHFQGEIQPDVVQATTLSGRAFGGTFALTAQYPLQSEGALILKGQFTDVDVGKALQPAMADAPQRLAGTAQLVVDLHAIGAAGAQIEATLAGSVTADMQGAVLKDFNVVNEVLGGATGLPTIGTLISNRVRPKYARLFAAGDSRFETLHGTFHIADRRVRCDDLTAVASDYGVRAGGTVSFDRDIDMRGTLVMSKRFTNDVLADIKEAKYVTDAQGVLALPFRLRGKLGRARPAPDLESFAGTLRQALTHGAARDVLGRLLGDKHAHPTPGTNEPRDLFDRRLRELLGR